eukprot:403371214
MSHSIVFEAVDALGPPQKGSNGLLSFPYFNDILQIIYKNGKETFAVEKKELLIRRRQLLKENKMDQYKEVVAEVIQREETIIQDLMMKTFDHIGLTEQELMKVYQFYMGNPQTQQIMMQGQLAPQSIGEKKENQLTCELTKEIFLFSEEKKMDQMKNMIETGKFGGMGGINAQDSDPYDDMMEMLVEQCKISDAIFSKYGVDEDELNFSMLKHNLMNDPEVQNVVMMNMQKFGINPSTM